MINFHNRLQNKNTYNCTNNLRFPISSGMFPVISLCDKFLNELANNKW